jgi:hypothetical protein
MSLVDPGGTVASSEAVLDEDTAHIRDSADCVDA